MSLPLPVDDLIAEFNVGPLVLTRRGVPTRNSYGEMVAATSSSVTIREIALHTASAQTRLMLPSSIRDNETRQGYTKIRVYPGGSGQASDVLAYQGRNWVCVRADDAEKHGGVFISLWQKEDVNA